MGTPCKIKLNNNLYYKHYDGWQGGITLCLLNSVIDNKICFETFIKNGNLEISDMVKNDLPLFVISDTLINNIDMCDFMLEGLNSIVRSLQRHYDTIKQEDSQTRYFAELRGETEERIENRMRLTRLFKNGYPDLNMFKDKLDLIERLKNV
jgi:hypothetical protein